MSVTTTQQTREAITVNGALQYKITVTVTDKGPLPSKCLFLLSIVDPTDPKADTFGRVAGILDFDAYSEDRVVSVRDQKEFFRVDNWVFYYNDLTTAINATDVLKTRIDELAVAWDDYNNQFITTTTETTEHPRTGMDAFTSLVAAYDNCVIAEAAALTARDEAQEALTAATTEAATAASAVTSAQTNYTDCVAAKGYFDSCLAAFSQLYDQANVFGGVGSGAGSFLTYSKTFRDAAHLFRTQCTAPDPGPPSDAQKAVYDGAESIYNSYVTWMGTTLSTFRGDLDAAAVAKNTATANQTLFAAYCTARQNALTTAQTNKANADTTVANARTAYEDALAAYNSAQQATEAAVAAIRALKPTWTPTDSLSGTSS